MWSPVWLALVTARRSNGHRQWGSGLSLRLECRRSIYEKTIRPHAHALTEMIKKKFFEVWEDHFPTAVQCLKLTVDTSLLLVILFAKKCISAYFAWWFPSFSLKIKLKFFLILWHAISKINIYLRTYRQGCSRAYLHASIRTQVGTFCWPHHKKSQLDFFQDNNYLPTFTIYWLRTSRYI